MRCVYETSPSCPRLRQTGPLLPRSRSLVPLPDVKRRVLFPTRQSRNRPFAHEGQPSPVRRGNGWPRETGADTGGKARRLSSSQLKPVRIGSAFRPIGTDSETDVIDAERSDWSSGAGKRCKAVRERTGNEIQASSSDRDIHSGQGGFGARTQEGGGGGSFI